MARTQRISAVSHSKTTENSLLKSLFKGVSSHFKTHKSHSFGLRFFHVDWFCEVGSASNASPLPILYPRQNPYFRILFLNAQSLKAL